MTDIEFEYHKIASGFLGIDIAVSTKYTLGNDFPGEGPRENYMDGDCDVMEDNTDIMASEYDHDYCGDCETGVIELEEVVVFAAPRLNGWQIVWLEIQVNARDLVTDIGNDARQFGQWLKDRFSGPRSLRGNRMSRGIGGFGIQFTSSQGKSGLVDTPVAAPGVEVITHNVDAWWDPFQAMWGPYLKFNGKESTPLIPDADGVDLKFNHEEKKLANDGVRLIKTELKEQAGELLKVEKLAKAFGYHVHLNPFQVDTGSVEVRFSGPKDKVKRQVDSLIKRNAHLKKNAQYWIDNP